MKNRKLYGALRAAVLFRRVVALRRLLYKHGVLAFADALTHCTPRVAADALSLLGTAERCAVLRHLSTRFRAGLQPFGLLADTPVTPNDLRTIASPCPAPTHARAHRA